MTEAKRFSYVPPSGPTDAKIVFVGEQPGMMEVRQRKPFVGPAGLVLTECMEIAKIIRSDCYFTNVVKDLDGPIKNYISIDGKKTIVTPQGQAYIDELANELNGMSPNIVVAVGNVALFALTSRTGVTKWRGSIVESTLVPGLKVIPIIHPATVLPPKFVYLNKHLIISDLQRALEQSSTSEIVKAHREYLIGQSFYDCMGYLTEVYDQGLAGAIIYFDIEIHNMELSCISFAFSPNEAISVPFINSTGDYFTLEQESEIILLIAKILENPCIKKCGQNVIFDVGFLFRRYGIHSCNLHDTMVAQQIIAPDYPKGLDFITSIWTDMPYYKDDGKQWFKVGGRWPTLWEYNARDSIACAIAFPKQLEELKQMENLETYDRQRLLVEPLAFMSEHGIRCDVEAMKLAYDSAETRMSEIQEELNNVAGRPLNPNSPKQLRDYFYITKGLNPYRKGGSPTVDDNALKRLARLGYVEARLIQEFRRLNKQRSNYLDVSHVDSDGRIRCSYNPVGTRYSRISSSKNIFGTGMNLQNWPHTMLRYLLADKDYVYYSFDLSQFENRIVAYVGDVTQMIEAFETGQDVHSLTASLIFGKPISEVTREDGTCPLGDGTHSERFWGKKANHGLNYDLGYKSFALLYEMPENEARAIIDRYHAAYPGVRNNFHGHVRRQLAETRTLTNLLGRKIRFMDHWDDKLFKEAYSCIPQSTCGDVINERGVNYIYYNPETFRQVDLLTQVHDSVGFQIPLSLPWLKHALLLNNIKRSLEAPLQWHGRSFVVPVDLSMGLNMGEVTNLSYKKWPETTNGLALWLQQTYDQKLNKVKDNSHV